MTRTTHVLAVLVLGAVTLAGCQTMTGRTAGTYTDDASTTAAIKSKIVADRPANLTAVGVDTVNGVVYLTGAVDTPEQRIRAEQLAWQASGVRQVVNNVQVRQPVAGAPSGVAAASPGVTTARRAAAIGTVTSVDVARNQVTVRSGNENLLLRLPASVVAGLRPGDQITIQY